MRTGLVVAVLALVAVAAPAQAGKKISERPDCAGQDQPYSKAEAADYRAAVLCLMNAVREDQGFGPLDADGKLRKAGQRWADHLGKTGQTSHGKSVAQIPKRIARAGYRATAVNEALGLGSAGDTPYELVANMMTDFACTEILDPRFRDAGVGVNLGKLTGFGRGIHVVVELGLKAGKKAPSRQTRPARTCPHALPKPKASPVVPVGVQPTVHDADITVPLRCAAKSACTFDATLKLVHQGATATLHTDALTGFKDLVFPFDPAALQAEQDEKHPAVELTIHTTQPYAFDDVFTVGL